MKTAILVAALMLAATLAAPVVTAEQTQTMEFQPDPLLTELGESVIGSGGTANVYNIAGSGDERPPLNVESWPDSLQDGIYSGALIEESQLQLNYIGVEKGDPLPYSYVAVGSVLNWTAQEIMNGAVNSTVRLPLVGEDRYDFISFLIYEITDSEQVELSVYAVQNGTRPRDADLRELFRVGMVGTQWGVGLIILLFP